MLFFFVVGARCLYLIFAKEQRPPTTLYCGGTVSSGYFIITIFFVLL